MRGNSIVDENGITQKGKDNASLRLERAIILALGLEKYEDYILSYDINLQ